MSLRSLAALVAVATVGAVSPVALAQRGDSGSIIGYVFDQTGQPIRGIKITAFSPTQIGGKKTAYTDDEGAFRFPVLDPGAFQVKAEAPKLRTYVQENVKVGLNAPVELNIVMEVASDKIEEVKIIQKTPMVSTKTANVKEVLDVDFVDSMPHDNRDVIFQQVANYAAGAIRGGRVRGGGGNQTLYMMDGFNMLRQYPTVKASAAYEIQTAGYGSENATAPGGVVNLVTRSGSNKFEFEFNATADHSRMEIGRDELDPDTQSHFYVLNPTISGPLIRDRLWYSINAEFLTRKTGREKDVEGTLADPLPELRNWYKGTIKVAAQLSPRNKLESVTNFDEFRQYNRTAGLGYLADSQTNHRSRNYFSGLILSSMLTDWMVFRSQTAFSNIERHTFPRSCFEDDNCDYVPAKVQLFPRRYNFGNASSHERGASFSFQFNNRLEFFLNSKSLGEHHVQLRNNWLTQRDTTGRSVPGDTIEEFNGNTPDSRTTYYSNDPRIEPARFGWFWTEAHATRNSLSISDTWRATRFVTITPGLAHNWATAYNMLGTVLTVQAVTPSIAVAWDATRDGRTALRASFNQYVDVDISGLAGHTLGSMVSQRCRWNETTGAYDRECTYSGGAASGTVGRPCGKSGIDETGQNCQQELTAPKTWEYTAGGEREVVEGLALGLDFIYRKFENQYERLETNRIWNGSGTSLNPSGSYRTGRNETISDLETPENAWRRYTGVTFSFKKREGNFKVNGSYTWSKLYGTVMDGSNNALGDIGPRDPLLEGQLPDDHRHEIKINFNYRVSPWLSTALRYSYYSGLPYNRYYRNDRTGSWEDLRARVGINPGNNLNDPADDRELRLPDIQSVNAQLSFNWLPLTGLKLETFIDILNVLALRTTNSVIEDEGVGFGTPRGREGPTRLRLGLRYRY